MLGTLPMVQPVMQREAEVIVKDGDDLAHIIFSLQFHYHQAKLRGQEIVVEIWTAAVPKRNSNKVAVISPAGENSFEN